MTSALVRTLTCAILAVGASATFGGEITKIDPATGDQQTAKLPTDKTDASKPDASKPDAPKPDASKPDAPTSDAPKTDVKVEVDKPADAPKASVSADAQKVLDQMSQAYAKLKTLELAGVFSGHFDAAGQQSGGNIEFTASFESPNKFRHTAKDDVLVGSTGEKAFAYEANDNIFAQGDAPKEKVSTKDLPVGLRDILSAQNPSLRLALAKDPAGEMTEDVKTVSRIDDAKIGDVSYPTLKFVLNDDTLLTVSVDPQTHLIRHVNLDLRAKLQSRKIPDIKEAFYAVDYTTTTPDAPAKSEQFAWAPPAGAKDIKDMKAQGGADEADAATALVGKAAPDFALPGLDGKDVSLAKLKGSVVILDIWATWCGPCRAALPHLDEFYQSKKADGLLVYAVDLGEEKDKVQEFVTKTKLGVPVLLDLKSEVAEKYKAEAIPETVLIGKDGKVLMVLVGAAPEEVEKLHKAAEEAMKK